MVTTSSVLTPNETDDGEANALDASDPIIDAALRSTLWVKSHNAPKV